MTSSTDAPAAAKFSPHPNHAMNRWLAWRLNVIDTTSLLAHPTGSSREKVRPVTLTEMATELGIVDPVVVEKLSYHQARLARYDKIQTWIYLVALIFIVLLEFITVPLIYDIGRDSIASLYGFLETHYELAPILNGSLQIILFILLLFLVYLVALTPIVLSLKVISILTDRRYAESITTWTLVCLLLELRDDNVLRDSSSRKALVQRIHDLAAGTALLSLQNPIKDGSVRSWSRKHFHQLEHYIFERAYWAVAPVETTLPDLRRDFRWLFDIYIHSMFGRLAWPQEATTASDEHPARWSEKLTGFLPRLLAFLIPIGILVSLIFNPAMVKTLNLEPDVIGLITLGWGLLGMDKLFGLGVTSTITDFLKGLKELTP